MSPIVFGDTFYFLALLNQQDDQHERAATLTYAHRGQIVTTAWVMTELADGLATSRSVSSYSNAAPNFTPTGPTRNGRSPIAFHFWSWPITDSARRLPAIIISSRRDSSRC
jgi:hypothetical protein